LTDPQRVRIDARGLIGLGAVIGLVVVFIGFLMVVKPTLWG
jgi:hypothetical protein